MRVEPLKLVTAGLSRMTEDNAATGTGVTGSFGQALSKAMDDVNQQQLDSEQASVNLAAGKVSDVSEVVIAAEKANLSLQLAMSVRNKVLEAYQQVMQMQV